MLHSATPAKAPAATVVELTARGVPVAWSVVPQSYQPHMKCSTRRAELYCIVVTDVGAHASQAQLFLARKNAFARSKVVRADTPTILMRDLDGDGDLDLAAELNTYKPSYANGKVLFSTVLLNGDNFGPPTGCTRAVPYSKKLAGPTSPAHGACPK